MTLQELICSYERDGGKIYAGNYECATDFLMYFDIHYKPILEQLAKEWAGASDARRFLADDLLKLFQEKEGEAVEIPWWERDEDAEKAQRDAYQREREGAGV